jgi:hypothetical protein
MLLLNKVVRYKGPPLSASKAVAIHIDGIRNRDLLALLHLQISNLAYSDYSVIAHLPYMSQLRVDSYIMTLKCARDAR